MANDRIGNIIKLSKDQQQNLINREQDIKDVTKALGSLKKLGMDVTMLEDQLKWATEVKDTLLKEFT